MIEIFFFRCWQQRYLLGILIVLVVHRYEPPNLIKCLKMSGLETTVPTSIRVMSFYSLPAPLPLSSSGQFCEKFFPVIGQPIRHLGPFNPNKTHNDPERWVCLYPAYLNRSETPVNRYWCWQPFGKWKRYREQAENMTMNKSQL